MTNKNRFTRSPTLSVFSRRLQCGRADSIIVLAGPHNRVLDMMVSFSGAKDSGPIFPKRLVPKRLVTPIFPKRLVPERLVPKRLVPKRPILLHLTLLFLSSQYNFVLPAHGFPSNKRKVPNGDKWSRLGHTKPSPSKDPALNVFGTAFSKAGSKWTTALCQADSDGRMRRCVRRTRRTSVVRRTRRAVGCGT